MLKKQENKLKILYVQQEFYRWQDARQTSYDWHLGIEEGFAFHNVEFKTLLLPCFDRAKEILKNENFDQVWVNDIIHTVEEVSGAAHKLRLKDLEWLRGLSPKMVGILFESIEYSDEEVSAHPDLIKRPEFLKKIAPYYTHILATEEKAAEWFQNTLNTPSLWTPNPALPSYVDPENRKHSHNKALFSGTNYLLRQKFTENPGLTKYLHKFVSPENETELPGLFDSLNQFAVNNSQTISIDDYERYLNSIRNLRRKSYQMYLEGLQSGVAVVNLPSYFKSYTSRVIEGMAAKRPVISWRIPERPRNSALFEDGKEILLFERDNPEELINHITKCIKNPDYCRYISENAYKKMKKYHTTEHRVGQILKWIKEGEMPDYGEKDSETGICKKKQAPERSASIKEPFRKSCNIKTTAFILTVEDPVFQYCLKAINEQNNKNFTTEIIRNVAPFSRAAQQMIEQCETEYFIQVDEDMILDNDAISKMEDCMESAADDVGMICFHLYDVDREQKIQGIKIYRNSLMKKIHFNDLKASEMDIIRQMETHGIKWVIHPDVAGKHGTYYTPESIYLRYKSMYEKDIRSWNIYTSDLHRKAEKYKKSGDILDLFAVLGAAHGIINAPFAQDKEKDYRNYKIKTLEVFKELLLKEPSYVSPYDPGIIKNENYSNLIPYDSGNWKNKGTVDIFVKNNAEKQALKILNTVEFYYPHIGGAETVVQRISDELVRRGHSVTVATTKLPGREFSELNGVQIKEFDIAGRTATGFSGKEAASYCDFLLNSNYDVMFNYAAQQWATDLAFESVIKNRNRVNVIAPCGYSALKDSKTVQWPAFNKYFNEIIPRIIPFYDAAIYHSKSYKDFIFANEHSFTNSLVIPNGAEKDEFLSPSNISFREIYNVKSKYLGLCVANYVEGKGQERVIDCIRQMKRPDFEMIFIGKEGEQLQELKNLAEGLPVRFLTNISRSDTVEAFKAADVFIYGSYVEAFPLVILEAKASKTPFVSTDCGNIKELNGGIVCDAPEMAGNVNRLLDDERSRANLANEGFKEWISKYTWDSIIDRYERLFLLLHNAKQTQN